MLKVPKSWMTRYGYDLVNFKLPKSAWSRFDPKAGLAFLQEFNEVTTELFAGKAAGHFSMPCALREKAGEHVYCNGWVDAKLNSIKEPVERICSILYDRSGISNRTRSPGDPECRAFYKRMLTAFGELKRVKEELTRNSSHLSTRRDYWFTLQFLEEWLDYCFNVTLFNLDDRHLAGIALAALRAGLIPLGWKGGAKQGRLEAYPFTGVKAPRGIAVDRANRPSGGTQAKKGSPAERAGWNALLHIPAQKAGLKFLRSFLGTTNRDGNKLLKTLSSRVIQIAIHPNGGELVLTFDLAPALKHMTMHCGAPWTGSVDKLPIQLAQALRISNGIRISASKCRFLHYVGPEMGFDYEWKIWEVQDKGKPIAQKLLAPVTNGSDLWVYRTNCLDVQSPKLAFVDHEVGELEMKSDDNPALVFLRLVEQAIVWATRR